MKKEIEILGVLFALIAYIPFAKIIREKPEKYNSTTMWLWCFVDGITGVSIYLEGGNYILAFLFVLGSYTMGIILWTLKKTRFGKTEIIITLCVVVCMMIWYLAGNIWATIASTTATVLAGIPQAKDFKKDPDKKALLVWELFFVGSTLSLIAGDGWDFESFINTRLFPLANMGLAFVMILLSLKSNRKYR